MRFLPFDEALALALSLNLASSKEWRAWCKIGARPAIMPACPDRFYKDGGWQGWGHWLGTGNVSGGQQVNHFLPFGQALTVAQSLSLASSNEWVAWCREGLRPPNVPSNPDRVYKDGGWQGWGHWLGTGNQGCRRSSVPFLPFTEALAVARSLGLASMFEWRVWCKEGLRPPSVPSTPHKTYKDGGWRGWGHWLGTGNQRTKKFLPFEEALAVARSLGLPGKMEWRVWSKEGSRPPDVPSAPNDTYKDGGWQGWGHWLGTGNTQLGVAKQSLPFGEALAVARSLGLPSRMEWQAWCSEGMCPANVPRRPDLAYKDHGWQGWGHWLGTGNLPGYQKKNFLPFDEALRAARQLRLVSAKEWRLWCRTGARPANVPACPDRVYAHDGWMGWTHWLRCGAAGGPALAAAGMTAAADRALVPARPRATRPLATTPPAEDAGARGSTGAGQRAKRQRR